MTKSTRKASPPVAAEPAKPSPRKPPPAPPARRVVRPPPTPPRRSATRRAELVAKVIPILKAKEAETLSDNKLVIAKYMGKINNRKTAIRAFCIQCSNGQPSEVRFCQVTGCALFAFRMGSDPFNRKSIRTAAERAEAGGEEELADDETDAADGD